MKLWETFWDRLIPEVTATVYMEDYGRPLPVKPQYPKTFRFMSPPQSDMAFVLAHGQFMRPMRDQPYWMPNDLKKPPKWRDATHQGIELVHGLVKDNIVESAYVGHNYVTVLTGHREAADWEDRVDELCDRIGRTAMVMMERIGGMRVVDYKIVEAPGMTDPRRFIY